MKFKRLVTLMFIVMMFSVFEEVARAQDSFYQQVIELPSQSKQQIFEKSKQWIAKTFISSKQVIEYENLQEGKLIGNGSVQFVGGYAKRLFGQSDVPIECQARFSMTEDIKEGKARITFDQITVRNDDGMVVDIDGNKVRRDNLKQKLITLTQNLTEYLSKSAIDKW